MTKKKETVAWRRTWRLRAIRIPEIDGIIEIEQMWENIDTGKTEWRKIESVTAQISD